MFAYGQKLSGLLHSADGAPLACPGVLERVVYFAMPDGECHNCDVQKHPPFHLAKGSPFRCISGGRTAVTSGIPHSCVSDQSLHYNSPYGHSGLQGRPVIKRAIVVTPSTLTQNWAAEVRKWLTNERCKAIVVQPGPDAASQVCSRNEPPHSRAFWPSPHLALVC